MADEVVNPASADAAVIKSAEEAVGQALAARTAYDAQATAAAATIAELKAQVAALSAPAPAPAPTDKLDAVERFMVRERHASRLDALRRMGAEGPFSDAQLLALAPDVDVKEADGLAKLEEWRKANLRLFRSPGPTGESLVTAATLSLGTSKSTLFSADKLAKSLFGGG